MDDKYAIALAAMAAKAQELGVQGVAIVMVQAVTDESNFRPQFRLVGRRERQPDPVNRGAADKGSNYLAIVWAKVAEMICTGKDSGSTDRVPRVGELGYPGGRVGLISDSGYYSAFSGGTGEQDLLIADAGLLKLLPDTIG